MMPIKLWFDLFRRYLESTKVKVNFWKGFFVGFQSDLIYEKIHAKNIQYTNLFETYFELDLGKHLFPQKRVKKGYQYIAEIETTLFFFLDLFINKLF